MKFGKEFKTHLEETIPEWRDKFLSYKPLKKLLKQASAGEVHSRADDFGANREIVGLGDRRIGSSESVNGGFQCVYPSRIVAEIGENGGRPWAIQEDWFVKLLDEELDKFNDFYVDKEEEFVIRLQELKERIERVKEKSNQSGLHTSESEFSEEMVNIRKDFVTIHGEMVLLKNYSSLNFMGLVKILKKYDKRTGTLLRLPFTQNVLHQPFFTIEPLTRLVRECEANLEDLFPSSAEVIEPGPPSNRLDDANDVNTSAQNPLSNRPDGQTDVDAPEQAPLQEDTSDIYRSTLAAMRAIQGLRRGSSTYNPLSWTLFLRGEGDEEVGTITVENSAPGSMHGSQNEEVDQEDVHSNN
ncbi:hypothetical protein AMTRI_Chr02g222670 [Amborella trichopoda]